MVMRLPVRYQAMASSGPDDNLEANIERAAATLELRPAETALLLVDTWGGHPIKSHRERTGEIIEDKIRPVLEAARACGVTPIYAPSPRVAPVYEQWTRYAGVADLRPVEPPDDGWPPPAYRRSEGPYASLRRQPGETPPGFEGPYPDWWHVRDIHPAIAPGPDDFVVATGDQLHRLLRDWGIVHLIYCGFALNICVRFRDYGMHALRRRGYQPILLRDCSTAIETRETIDELAITRTVLADLERWFVTADSADFISASRSPAR